MVGIVSSGIGSGLDVQGLVAQLVAAEGQPTRERLVLRETQFQAQLSAYGSLRSALDTFKTAAEKLGSDEALAKRTVTASDEEAASVSATADAVPSRYTVSIANTAQAERLTSSAFVGSTATVGDGTLTLSIGGNAFSVEISAEANSLADIRSAINAASDNTGIQASIINADGASYLVLAGDETGSDNTITVTQSGGDGGLAALVYDPDGGTTNLTRSQAADDARAEINGFSVSSSTNTFDAVIDGVTFTALQATDGETFTIDVANDTDEVKKSVISFSNAYNGLVSRISELTSFDAETNVAGALQGDSTVLQVSTLLRNELTTATEGAAATLDTLSEIGVQLDENGNLQVDEDQLDTIIADSFNAVERLFSGDNGYVARITGILDTYVRSEGLLETRTDGLKSSIEALTDQNEQLNNRLAALETRLLRQFNGLDTLLAQLNSTSSFLTAQLANLPTPSRSSS
ncbi:MAG: flagellar filament capping protein FliD [Pseudomonadota bacterium]